jgi:hypothetical protein
MAVPVMADGKVSLIDAYGDEKWVYRIHKNGDPRRHF